MYTEREIGLIVRELRGELSLRAFARKCGISHTSLDNIEKGIDFRTGKPTQPKVSTLLKIAKAANVSLSYIIGEEIVDDKILETEDELTYLINLMPPEMKAMYVEALKVSLKAQGII